MDAIFVNSTSTLTKKNRKTEVNKSVLLEVVWEVILYLPYSREHERHDYTLFRNLQNSLIGKAFNNYEEIANHAVLFRHNFLSHLIPESVVPSISVGQPCHTLCHAESH